ncbi:MAG: hypothetical protein IME96_10385 [Proteobacteria bacterium]|nr:hypothetical protein [Pseudomonadota bacterium]
MMEQFLLSCRALASPTLCRFIPALSVHPRPQPWQKRQITGVRVQPWHEGLPGIFQGKKDMDRLSMRLES